MTTTTTPPATRLRLSTIALEILQTADSLRRSFGSASSDGSGSGDGTSSSVSRKLVGLLHGTLHTSSGQFSTGIKELRENDLLLVHTRPPRLTVTTLGGSTLMSMNQRTSNPYSCNTEIHDRVKTVILQKKNAKGYERKIRLLFDVLAHHRGGGGGGGGDGDASLSRNDLAIAAKQRTLQSGPSVTALKYMFDCGIVEYPRQGMVRMVDEMFPFGRVILK
jgi:hypothetical protein